MNTSIHSLRRLGLLALSVAVACGGGCATSGRHVLLKEYGATVPPKPDSPLKGKTICVKNFQCAPSLTTPKPQTEPEQPAQFTFVEFTPEQSKTWDREFRGLKKSTAKESWREIGNVRNGFGMVLSHVHALNDPGAWLADTLRMDLESQGAKVVGPAESESADISVSGTIRFCRVDIFMKIWGDLVVDFELQPKGRVASRSVLHTEGGTTAWVGSTAEFYHPLREARQKFSWLAAREIAKALSQTARPE